jgi:hypothetical protein
MPEFEDWEVFATAVEQGVSPGRAGDGALARDLAVVGLLRTGGAELGPRPDERARARARVLARVAAADDPSDHPTRPAAPSPTALLSEPAVDTTDDAPVGSPVASPGDELASRRGRRSGNRHVMPDARRGSPVGGRIVLVAAAAVLGTAVIGGAGVLASRDALPGDNLYGIKRAAESVGTAMTWDDAARGRRHLDLASTRIDEMEQLAARDPQAPPDPEVYRDSLRDFDSEADQGSELLLASQDVPREQAQNDLQTWAAGQAERLAALRPALPVPALSDAVDSLTRLDQLTGTDPMAGTSACTADGCVGDQADPTATTSQDAATTTVDPGQAGRTPATGQQPGSTPQEQSRSAPQQDSQPGLLPGLLPGTDTGGTSGGQDDQAPTSTPNSGGKGSGGLPPLQVPPIGPLPGVSIG